MSLIKIKDKGQTPDQFETLVVNTAVAVEATLGNIIVSGENGSIVDSGKAVSEITSELDSLGSEVESLGSEVETLKKSVSDGKTLLANAITEMGIETASDASFETMASNVSELSTAGEYIWARYTVVDNAKGELVDYITDTDESAYPDGGEVDGYWYEVIDQQDAITYTPSTVDQVIPGGTLLTGDLIVVGDENLVPSNIAEGVNVFGTLGTFASGHKYIKRFFEQQITIPGMSRGTFELAQTLDNPSNAFFFGNYLISSDDNVRFESMTNTTVTLFNYMSSSYTVYFSVMEFTDKLKSKDSGMHLCSTYDTGWTGTTPTAPYIALCQATTYNQKADIAILDATYDTSDFNNRTTASSRAAVTLSSGKLKYTVKQNKTSSYHYIHHYYAEFYE